jgi:hypothetical protein
MLAWIQKLFSDSSEASFSRFACFLALIAVIAWVSYLVWKKHELPELTGATSFPAVMYFLGKGAESVQKIFGRP